ncbi:hypothetical protein L3X38_021300 [Prunus dulcis]|uniref:Uncharacterized protein n=1 Tax=Prunus dulcis TaxID=3755 RepID=A0AAD4VVD9_PRUDU|nr:hypothetical protein L3X38_021300 [Prunus dulcis]
MGSVATNSHHAQAIIRREEDFRVVDILGGRDEGIDVWTRGTEEIGVFVWERNVVDGFSVFKRVPVRAMPKLRHVAFNLTDFGAMGDGVTLNTEAFEKAMLAISKLGKKGCGQPNVPPVCAL